MIFCAFWSKNSILRALDIDQKTVNNMVDGGPVGLGVTSASSSGPHEFYVVDHNTRVNLSQVPLQALSRKTKSQLSQLLNGIKILPSEEGFLRDWRGLASCAKLKSESVNRLEAVADPTKDLLDLWVKQSDGGISLGDLQSYLGQIDRWDVVDDTNICFCKLSSVASHIYH